MPALIRLLTLFLGLFVCSQVFALDLAPKTPAKGQQPQISVWIDEDGSASFSTVSSGAYAEKFQPASGASSPLNLGFLEAPVWIRLDFCCSEAIDAKWILELAYLGIDHADLLLPDGTVLHNGSLIPLSERPVFSRFYAFPISLSAQPKTYYLRIQSAYPISIPLRLIEAERFAQLQTRENLLQFLYFGGLLSLLIYNFMLFVVIRDDKYLIYSLFTFFTGLGIFAGNGYANMYLWPDSAAWDAISQPLLLSIGGSLGVLFSTRFLRTSRHLPKTHAALRGLMGLYAVISVLLLLRDWLPLPLEYLFKCLFLVSLATPIVVLGAAIRNIRYNIQSSRYFLAAWGVLCVGVFVAAARVFGLLPSNGWTLYALQISSGLEMLLFSLALAYRFQRERTQREQAQNALIRAQDDALQALQISEERLEKAVDSRTYKLQKLLLSEQQMRSQYTRFCALIAHEFRNPLNVIQAQATMLYRDVSPTPEKNHQRIEIIRSGIRRLVTLFDQWLANDRVNMSLDQLQISSFDPRPWIEDLVQGCRVYYDQHTFNLEIVGRCELLSGDKHLLEIAILNLIDNACKYSLPDSTVKICLYEDLQHGELCLAVTDKGPGIDQSHIKLILQPYTRAVPDHLSPDGIGLGLAFVDRIVSLHDGRIEIDSVLGGGTTITLCFPFPKP